MTHPANTPIIDEPSPLQKGLEWLGLRTIPLSELRAKYETPDKDREQVFEKLTRAAEAAVTAHPGRAEPLIWQAIIVSSDAGENGGFSALGKVKKARDLLLEAEKINAHALDGSVYTSLGSLYCTATLFIPRKSRDTGVKTESRKQHQIPFSMALPLSYCLLDRRCIIAMNV